MTDTANLALPCIEGSQAQKHVTHNDALRILDTLVQLAVLDRDLTAPPGSPAEGQRWIVKTGATGAWSGHVNAIAAWQDGAWIFSAPQTGWITYVADEGTLLVWNGTAWGDFFSTVTSIQNLALLGVGTTAGTTNVLSAKLNNVLFAAKTTAEGGSGDLRYKLSKAASGNTLSVLFQDNYSGRAEIGLTGDDDFHFKVSPDGSTWTEGIRVAAATGKVSFPVNGGPRELLGANRTYYVRTDGSDGNNGLANTSGGAWLTIQHAFDFIKLNLDLASQTITVQIGDGSYAGGLSLSEWVGGGTIMFQGNTGAMNNVVLSANNAISNSGPYTGEVRIQYVKLTGAGTAILTLSSGTGLLTYGSVNFAGTPLWHIMTNVPGARIRPIASYTISASPTGNHIANFGGNWSNAGAITITLTGTPNWPTAFVTASNCCVVEFGGTVTFSGSATGKRYNADTNSVIQTYGQATTFFPGNAAGTTATNGVYA